MKKLCVLLFAVVSVFAGGVCEAAEITLGEWIRTEQGVSVERMFRNISPPDAVPGSVVASPSKQSPNYYFHWTRDSSLVMDRVVALYAGSHGTARAGFLKAIGDYIALSRLQQTEPSAEGLGEPRFLVDGTADTTPWARPQYDGPALRALTLVRFLRVLPGARHSNPEAQLSAAAEQVIRTDLDFVAQVWGSHCYDLWEELRGLHFYTQSVQYSALLAGARLFSGPADRQFASRLGQAAAGLKLELEKYWDEQKGQIDMSRELEPRPGAPADDPYKQDGLDTAVILAALHSRLDHGILSVIDDRMLATAHALEAMFEGLYAINVDPRVHAMGRFHDDVYFGGNPWYMTTAAFAELYYRVARAIERDGGITATQRNAGFLSFALTAKPGQWVSSQSPDGTRLLSALRQRGDDFLSTVRRYTGSQGEMAEQIDRDAGVPASAYDLSWSYAGFLSAVGERPRSRH